MAVAIEREGKRNTLFRVIEANELEGYCRSGWSLHQVLNEQKIDYGSESLPVVVNNYVQRESKSTPFVLTVTRYLMMRREDHPLAEKDWQIEQLKNDKHVLDQTISDRDTEIKNKNKELETLKGKLASETDMLEYYRKEHKAADEIKRKMETDIAKIRKAVGELKMKEILAS